MANLLSSSCSIGSPMALKPFPFSIHRMVISGHGKVGCFCVVSKDGSPTQAAKGGGADRVQIKCSFTHKVYEDKTKGIACYIDEKGEIICEGYDDEGPRTDAPCLFGHPRDEDIEVDIIKLLERSCLQFANGNRCAMKADYSSEDFLN